MKMYSRVELVRTIRQKFGTSLTETVDIARWLEIITTPMGTDCEVCGRLRDVVGLKIVNDKIRPAFATCACVSIIDLDGSVVAVVPNMDVAIGFVDGWVRAGNHSAQDLSLSPNYPIDGVSND